MLDGELIAIRKEQLKNSFYDFVIDAFEVLNPTEKLISNWHIEDICDVLQKEIERIIRGEKKEKDIIINIPPRSLKSIVCTVCLPAWAWTKDPSLKFIGTSYSSELSTEHNMYTRKIVESEWYKMLFGDTVNIERHQNKKTNFANTCNGIRKCTSTGGTVTGTGADVIIIDDPLNPKQANSEAERVTANKFFDETLYTRLNRPEIGLFIIVMQRLHESDLTGHLLAKNPDAFAHYCYPAELTDYVSPKSAKTKYKNGLLFSERFTPEYLKGAKESMGSYGYSGQMLQNPAPLDGGIFKKNWFEIYGGIEHKGKQVDFFVDGAYTAKKENDPSGIISTVYHNNILYITNIGEYYLEFPDFCKKLVDFVSTNGYSDKSIIEVEPKATGKSVVQAIKKETKLNIKESTPPDRDKVTRAQGITSFVESGRVKLVKGHWNERFLHQVCTFPKARHDEFVDLLVMAVNRYYKNDFFVI